MVKIIKDSDFDKATNTVSYYFIIQPQGVEIVSIKLLLFDSESNEIKYDDDYFLTIHGLDRHYHPNFDSLLYDYDRTNIIRLKVIDSDGVSSYSVPYPLSDFLAKS